MPTTMDGYWRLEWAAADESWLDAAGWLDAGRIMSLEGEAAKVVLEQRHTHRVIAPNGSAFYLKRDLAIGFGDAVRQRFGGGPGRSPAGCEWSALHRLAVLEVSAPIPVLVGEEVHGGLVRRSFLLTRAMAGHPTFESIVLERAPGRSLVEEIATTLRRMHAGGLYHRDFYAGHIAIDEGAAPGGRVTVFDLNRAGFADPVAARWRVKDVAALHFSVPSRTVNGRLRTRFLKAYMPESDAAERRRFGTAVERKALRMLAHARRRIARGAPNFHINE